MACYSPLLMFDTGEINPSTGKHIMEFRGRADKLYDPSSEAGSFVNATSYMVPCNRCIGCRLDYARQWANRMVLELMDCPEAIFVTLTYNDEHLPYSLCGFPTVSVRDCQLFMKRLRRHFPDKKLRYFLASEYGPMHGRPHYHAIIFGLQFSDFSDLRLYKYNNLNQPLFISTVFEEIWGNGFCTIGGVTRDTCNYTARYMLKKLKGKDKSFYEERDLTPEFTLSSRRPGIGLGYFDNHEFTDKVTYFDGNKVVSFPLPKKVFDKLVEYDPDLYESLKVLRKDNAVHSAWLEWQQSDLEYLEYLDLKETEIYNRIKGISSDTRLDI